MTMIVFTVCAILVVSNVFGNNLLNYDDRMDESLNNALYDEEYGYGYNYYYDSYGYNNVEDEYNDNDRYGKYNEYNDYQSDDEDPPTAEKAKQCMKDNCKNELCTKGPDVLENVRQCKWKCTGTDGPVPIECDGKRCCGIRKGCYEQCSLDKCQMLESYQTMCEERCHEESLPSFKGPSRCTTECCGVGSEKGRVKCVENNCSEEKCKGKDTKYNLKICTLRCIKPSHDCEKKPYQCCGIPNILSHYSSSSSSSSGSKGGKSGKSSKSSASSASGSEKRTCFGQCTYDKCGNNWDYTLKCFNLCNEKKGTEFFCLNPCCGFVPRKPRKL